MIIQCEQCNTKFRLDDSKVTDKGVKVRCAKCRHVFTVSKDPDETEAQPDLDAMLDQTQPDFGAMLDQSVAYTPDELPAPSAPQQEPPVVDAAPEPDLDYSDFVSNDFADQETIPEVGGFEPPTDEITPASAPGDDFSLSTLEEEQGFAFERIETGVVTGEVPYDAFDVGSGVADADKTVIAAAPAFDYVDIGLDQVPSGPSASSAEDAGTFDFGDIPMEPPRASVSDNGSGDAAAFDFGGEVYFDKKDVAPLSETAAGLISSDFGANGSADSPGAMDTVVAETSLSAAEPEVEESFNLGDFQFGDETAAQPAVQEALPEPEPIRDAVVDLPVEPLKQPESDTGEDTLRKGPAVEMPQAAREELPPLSITSRRKQSPLFGVLIAVATVVAVVVLGFFGYTMFQEDKGKVATEAGRITVRAVNASFVNNPVIGDLLVITGEAVNSFSKPRAVIQIKGMVYGAGGQVLVTKNAYCGNPLTKEQLSTLSLDKIEAVMANQFGDSLANMEVAPGKAIPFVIVIPKPPAEARDYGVEPTGSTVATGKQQ